MGLPIFYVEPGVIESSGGLVHMTGDEAKHLARSLRARVGEVITIGDGAGGKYTARITRIGPHDAEATIESFQRLKRELPQITMVQAVANPRRMDVMIRMAAEAGAARVSPFLSPVISQGTAEKAQARVARWRKIAVESSKSARRAWPLTVSDVNDWPPPLPGGGLNSIILWEGERERGLSDVLPAEPPPEVCLVTGPEGGFTEEEARVLRDAGGVTVNLGDVILRTESAGSYVAMIIRFYYGLLGGAVSRG